MGWVLIRFWVGYGWVSSGFLVGSWWVPPMQPSAGGKKSLHMGYFTSIHKLHDLDHIGGQAKGDSLVDYNSPVQAALGHI